MLAAGAFLLSFMGVNAQSSSVIWHTSVPEWGNASANLYGKVSVNPQSYKVAGLIFLEEAGGWWTKPSFASPTVPIASDSSFVLDFTGSELDRYCTRLLTVLVPNTYQVPVFGGVGDLPEDFLDHPYAIVARPHGDRKLEWSGINWTVKRSVNDIAVSPGPNLFSADENHVFIDEDSCLHLTITSPPPGQWLCSELIADTSLGYGTYTFNLTSRVDNFDLNTILGIFTWDDLSEYATPMPEDYFREYDIEFGYWSVPGNEVGQYVIQPWNIPENIYRFPMGSEVNTIHQWTWETDVIEFVSMREDSSIIAQFEYDGVHFKEPGAENIRINLWLNFGQAPQTSQEAILSGFHFENILAAPENVSATDGNPQKVTVSWVDQPGKYFGVYRSISDDPMASELLTPEWISEPVYDDYTGQSGTTYYYRVRCSDNAQGSNTSGYASGFSDYDTGWSVDTTMSVVTHELSEVLQISPNPCDDFVRIVSINNDLEGELRLLDTKGRRVLETPFVYEVLLPVTKLAPGVYFLQLITSKGKIYPAKLVVNHS